MHTHPNVDFPSASDAELCALLPHPDARDELMVRTLPIIDGVFRKFPGLEGHVLTIKALEICLRNAPRVETSYRAYVSKVAWSEACKQIRRERELMDRQRQRSLTDEDAEHEPNVEASVINNIQKETLISVTQKAIQSLPDDYRNVLWLVVD